MASSYGGQSLHSFGSRFLGLTIQTRVRMRNAPAEVFPLHHPQSPQFPQNSAAPLPSGQEQLSPQDCRSWLLLGAEFGLVPTLHSQLGNAALGHDELRELQVGRSGSQNRLGKMQPSRARDAGALELFPTFHICDYNCLVPAAAANVTLRHHDSGEEAYTGGSSRSQPVLGTCTKNGPSELILHSMRSV